MRMLVTLLVLGLGVFPPGAASAQEMTISAAVSMKDAVEALAKRFMQGRSGVTLRYNFGSSGELQKQIEAGAPVDVFVSAAQRQMGELEREGPVVGAGRRGLPPQRLGALQAARPHRRLSP